MAKSPKRPLAALMMKQLLIIGNFILKAKAIVLNIGNNPLIFVTPSPTLASVTTHIGNLETAETLAATRAIGTAAARDLKYGVVLDDLHLLLNYVQNTADAAPNYETAISIIQASGFSVKVNGKFIKPPLAAKNGKVSGTVNVVAKSAGKRASYNWQYSNNNGTAWIDLPATLVAKTMVTGLTPTNHLLFRMRSITKEGISGWSDPVSLIVQ
jgi:hypothetical protein